MRAHGFTARAQPSPLVPPLALSDADFRLFVRLSVASTHRAPL